MLSLTELPVELLEQAHLTGLNLVRYYSKQDGTWIPSKNSANENHLTTIPEGVVRLSRLTTLLLSENPITALSHLANLQSLQSLDNSSSKGA